MLVTRIVSSAVVVVVAWILARYVISRLIMAYATRLGLEAHTAQPVRRVLVGIVYVVAFVVLLGIWGLRGTLTGMLAGAGIAGIVIGMALRDIIADLLAGVILFFDRPFKIGDAMTMGDVGGTVLDIGIRSVRLKTWDGVYVTIPNSKVYAGVVKNYSHYDRRRLEMVVGVDYDSDLNRVQEALRRVLKRGDIPVLEEPEPIIALESLSGSSIDFKVLFWYGYDTGMPWITFRGMLMQAVVEEFRREGISIPFPQVTISQRDAASAPTG